MLTSARTPTALAWRRIFGTLGTPSILESFSVMFDDEEFLDTRAFQSLHKIVLGLSGANLRERLQLSTSDIDEVDADGRTALSWAATRDDVGAVKTLLEFGADPNLPSIWGQLPLHCATHNKKESPIEILEDLIAHGTDVNALDHWKRTALCYTSGNYRDLETLQLLVSKGTAINVRDLRLRTPLGYTARLGHSQHAKYLLECGADANIPDEFNVTPLFDVVRNNFHELLPLFIPVSKPIETRPFGSSLLHWIASNADATTLNIILKYSLSEMFLCSDISLHNAEGLTPLDVFNNRPTVTKEEEEGFLTLTEQISAIDRLIEKGEAAEKRSESDENSETEWFETVEAELDPAETSEAEEYSEVLQIM